MSRETRSILVFCLLLALLVTVVGILPPRETKANYDPNANRKLQYTNVTIPTGNTITGTTAESFYASQYTVPASNTLGAVMFVYFSGVYTSPLIAGGSTVTKLYIGSSAVITTPSFVNAIGGTNLTFSGVARIKIVTIGISGKLFASGYITYNTGTTTSTTVDISNTAMTTMDLTKPMLVKLSVQNSLGTISTTLNDLTIEMANPIATN